MPRTNNVAEGWNNAFATMSGANRPTAFKFIDGLKKDEVISRAKMIKCNSGEEPAPQKRRDADRIAAIKKSVLTYIERKETEAKNSTENSSENDDEVEEDEDIDMGEQQQLSSNQWSRSKSELTEWKKSPEMLLLSAIANNNQN